MSAEVKDITGLEQVALDSAYQACVSELFTVLVSNLVSIDQEHGGEAEALKRFHRGLTVARRARQLIRENP